MAHRVIKALRDQACNDAESGVVNGPPAAEVLCSLGVREVRRYAYDAGLMNKPEGGRGRAGVVDDDEHEGEQEGGAVQHAGLRPTLPRVASGLRLDGRFGEVG